jgi:hypothetical protein
MGWDKGRYYTRSRKVGGRVVREYVGSGRVAELAAQLDSLAKEQRRLDAAIMRGEKSDLAATDAEILAVVESADLAARAALLAAGFRRHKRGEWRKQRDHK